MKIKELRQKKIGDLHKLLKSSREELRSLRFSISSEQEKNVRKIRDVKKDVAKILTILNTKEPISAKVEKVEEVKKEEILNKKEVSAKGGFASGEKKDQVKLDK